MKYEVFELEYVWIPHTIDFDSSSHSMQMHVVDVGNDNEIACWSNHEVI